MSKTILLSQDEVKSLITMDDVLASVDKTFKGMGDGTVINPTKVNLDLGETAEYPPYRLSDVGRACVLERTSGFFRSRKMPMPCSTQLCSSSLLSLRVKLNLYWNRFLRTAKNMPRLIVC